MLTTQQRAVAQFRAIVRDQANSQVQWQQGSNPISPTGKFTWAQAELKAEERPRIITLRELHIFFSLFIHSFFMFYSNQVLDGHDKLNYLYYTEFRFGFFFSLHCTDIYLGYISNNRNVVTLYSKRLGTGSQCDIKLQAVQWQQIRDAKRYSSAVFLIWWCLWTHTVAATELIWHTIKHNNIRSLSVNYVIEQSEHKNCLK